MLPALPLTAAAAPSLAGPLIGAGSALGGGLISGFMNMEGSAKDRAFQRETMQNAIQWRVADAKKAGLHPLFAMGANVSLGGGSPQFIGDPIGPSLAEAGQNISNALARQQTVEERQKHQMDLSLAAKSMEESDARIGLLRSQIRSLEQAPGGLGLGVQSEAGQAPAVPGITGVVELKPQPQMSAKSGRPDTLAGTHPWFGEMQYGPFKIPVPYGGGEHPEETLSEMSYPATLGWLGQVRRMLGAQEFARFLKYRYLGSENAYLPGEGTMSAVDRAIGDFRKEWPRYKRKFNKMAPQIFREGR
ncbi:minor capsid protein [Microviridae sp.]|nr:minor capsid protein [Microviridae sp.]